jgi:hypothetical protein
MIIDKNYKYGESEGRDFAKILSENDVFAKKDNKTGEGEAKKTNPEKEQLIRRIEAYRDSLLALVALNPKMAKHLDMAALNGDLSSLNGRELLVLEKTASKAVVAASAEKDDVSGDESLLTAAIGAIKNFCISCRKSWGKKDVKMLDVALNELGNLPPPAYTGANQLSMLDKNVKKDSAATMMV